MPDQRPIWQSEIMQAVQANSDEIKQLFSEQIQQISQRLNKVELAVGAYSRPSNVRASNGQAKCGNGNGTVGIEQYDLEYNAAVESKESRECQFLGFLSPTVDQDSDAGESVPTVRLSPRAANATLPSDLESDPKMIHLQPSTNE